jgi:hypothetical protein
MPFFKPAILSPAQMERREKTRAKGRKHYILYRGILGWEMSVFVITNLWDWRRRYGWHVPQSRGDLYLDLLFGLVLWSVMGYFVGAILWKQVFE